jgi:hypothetical protein
MTIADIEHAIIEARNESLACAIVGDSIGALDAHNEATRLEQQRAEAMHAELRFSDK